MARALSELDFLNIVFIMVRIVEWKELHAYRGENNGIAPVTFSVFDSDNGQPIWVPNLRVVQYRMSFVLIVEYCRC